MPARNLLDSLAGLLFALYPVDLLLRKSRFLKVLLLRGTLLPHGLDLGAGHSEFSLNILKVETRPDIQQLP